MVADLCADAWLPIEEASEAPGAAAASSGPGEARPSERVRSQCAGDAAVTDWRGFHDALRRAALAATQSGAPLSLLLLDPAGPGRNGQHLAGTAARARTQALDGMIAAEAGKGSALARYAEERLAVILLETGLGDAVVRAERIGRSLCCEAGALARPAIGVAQFRDDEALGHLIERAEDALDRARSDGALIAVAGHRARSARGRTSWTTT
jgi:GGDEF domain-containing protein